MKDLEELATKAQQTASLLTDDLKELWAELSGIQRPESRNLFDKASTAYAQSLLTLARELEAKLMAL